MQRTAAIEPLGLSTYHRAPLPKNRKCPRGNGVRIHRLVEGNFDGRVPGYVEPVLGRRDGDHAEGNGLNLLREDNNADKSGKQLHGFSI